jgi:hypothetical protein
MLVHACRFGRSRLSPGSISPTELQADLRLLRGTHQRLWLARNRPGGLRDSLRRLELPGAAS